MQWMTTISEPLLALLNRSIESVPGLLLPGLIGLAAVLLVFAFADRVVDRSGGSLAE